MRQRPRFNKLASENDPRAGIMPFVRRLVLLGILALCALPPGLAAGQYTLGFECPDAVPQAGVPNVCPAYVLDREDILGSPRLVIDPQDASLAAFGALHGGRGIHATPGAEPPTARSRDDAVHQPHTTFTTKDGGATWTDYPYHAPDSMRGATREVYGDDVAIALDTAGRLHIAALYSTREAAGPLDTPAPFQNVVAVWKGHDIRRDVDYLVNVILLQPEDPALPVDSIHLLAVPDARLVALTWREGAPEDGRLALFYSLETQGASWARAELDVPCAASSNPIALGTRILVACRDAPEGAWQVQAIDTATWTATRVDEAPLATPRATLLTRTGDYVVLVGSGVVDGAPTVQLTYGEAGARWSAIEEIAPDLTRADPVDPLADARVTAAAYNPMTGNIHLVYLERYDVAAGSDGQPELYKVFASVRAEGTFQGMIDLGIGTVNRAAFSPTLTGVGAGAFDDLHDGIAIWQDPRTGVVREFVAFGDYGFVRYAEVVETNFLSPIVPLTAQVPPVPLASAGSVPVLVGVPAGILAGAMVARTVWARKQATAEAPSE